jgi:excisionase family DNA binding protein
VSLLAATFSPELIAELQGVVRAEVAAALTAREPRPKRWLSVSECAEYLGASQRAVYQRMRRGTIPTDAVRHVGRSVLIDRAALDRQLERS